MLRALLGLSLLGLVACSADTRGLETPPPQPPIPEPIVEPVGEPRLAVLPGRIDLVSQVDCSTTRALEVVNVGEVPVSFTPALTGDRAFSVDRTEELALAPDERVTLNVVFAPEQVGASQAELAIGEVVAPIRGSAAAPEKISDSFLQPNRPKGDMLWVIDGSPSTFEEQQFIEDSLEYFRELFAQSHADLRVAFTSTDMSSAAGRIYPLDAPRVLTATASFEEWLELLPGTAGSTTSRGLAAAVAAISEPLASGHNAAFRRPDAFLTIFLVSVGDDESPGPTDRYTSVLGREAQRFVFAGGETGCTSGEISALPSPRYLEGFRETDYFTGFCGDWSELFRTTTTPGEERFFIYLSATPIEGTIEVIINGEPLPSEQGTYWSYDSATRAVRVRAGIIGPYEDHVLVRYDRACD